MTAALAAGHGQAQRVYALLRATGARLEAGMQTPFPDQSLGIEVTFTSPAEPTADATN